MRDVGHTKMKVITIALVVICVALGATSLALFREIRERDQIIASSVHVRAAHARLHRGLATCLTDGNDSALITNVTYLLYMDTCLADVALLTSYTAEQAALLTEEARLAKAEIDHPLMTNIAASLNRTDLLERALWPKPRQKK